MCRVPSCSLFSSVACQKQHRPKHKRACKKRAAELRDEILFRQPESGYLGDCPICFLPHFPTESKCAVMTCCGQSICVGCMNTNDVLELKEKRIPKCPFYRHPIATSKEESNERMRKRADMNDPVALREVGVKHRKKGDYQTALHYFLKAAELGYVGSHFDLARLYATGDGVEKDESKEFYHLEQAAIAGHAFARHNLGVKEWEKGNTMRAVKHLIISTNLGDDLSLNELKKLYQNGFVSNDDFAAALRAHQAAADAMKSPQREEGLKHYRPCQVD